MKILLIGCGKMGGALLTQWLKTDVGEFFIVDPMLETGPDGVKLYRTFDEISDQSFDLLVVAIKPQLVDDILPQYSNVLAADGFILSIAAGCSVERLKQALPNASAIRVMPNLPSAVGAGVSGIFASEDVNPAQQDVAETMMRAAGKVVWVDTEDQLDRVTAVAGSGPGYVFEIARAYVAAAMALGFDRAQARDLVLGTIAGAIEMADQSSEDLETLRNSVTSKNGTTEAGLTALNGDGNLDKLLRATTEAAYRRAVELR